MKTRAEKTMEKVRDSLDRGVSWEDCAKEVGLSPHELEKLMGGRLKRKGEKRGRPAKPLPEGDEAEEIRAKVRRAAGYGASFHACAKLAGMTRYRLRRFMPELVTKEWAGSSSWRPEEGDVDVRYTMRKCGYTVRQAARLLGVFHQSVHRWWQSQGISGDDLIVVTPGRRQRIPVGLVSFRREVVSAALARHDGDERAAARELKVKVAWLRKFLKTWDPLPADPRTIPVD